MEKQRFIQFFVVVLFLLSTGLSGVSAQNFTGGFSGGLVASEVSGDNLGGLDKTGFYASAFTGYPLSRYSNLKLEIMYIRKGSRAKPSEENNYFDYLFALNYVEIPVLYVQNFSGITSLRYLEDVSFEVGLSASFLVNHKEEEDGFSISENRDKEFNPAELNLLLRLNYPLNDAFLLSLGYSNSLTPIRSHATGATTWIDRGQYNSVWTAGISYNFW